MKKSGIVFIFLIMALIFSGCGQNGFKSNIADVKVDLGTSKIYSQKDLEEAANIILNEMESWQSVKEVYIVYYCGDETAQENIDYCNMLTAIEYSQCVVFKSSFKSASSAYAGGFNPNSKYDDWQWFLARTDNGEWELLTHGY